MNRPHTSKVMLVAAPRGATSSAGSEPLRRYRLARLRLDGRSPQPKSRFDHLKRVFD